MKHIQVEIIANEFQQEELIALLNDFEPSGFEQTEEVLKAYFEEALFDKHEVLKIVKGYDYTITDVNEQNWNAVWEQNFQPVVVEDFCAVRADFHEPIASVQYEIVITPKMSFGTGHHATTYMMMQQMRGIEFRGKQVFDFGTGTGILAILAEKLGASHVQAIDVDEWSIENAKENFERNDCSQIEVTLSSKIPEGHFDVVLANINRNVLLEYMPELKAVLRPGATVLFSGLLIADETIILEAAGSINLALVKRLERAGWISLCCTNAM